MKRIIIAVVVALSVCFCFVGSAMAEKTVVYTVKAGDTLSQISQEVFGTWRLWERIAKENRINNPRRLQVGQTLVIHDVFRVIPEEKSSKKVIPILRDNKKIKPVTHLSARLVKIKLKGQQLGFAWHPGRNPWKKSIKSGVIGLGFSADTALEVVEQMRKGQEYSWATINHSGKVTDEIGNEYRMIRMGFGNGVFKNFPRPAWKDTSHLEAGRIYKVGDSFIMLPLACKNPTLLEMTFQKVDIPDQEPGPGISQPGEPGVGEDFVFIPPSEENSNWIIEHEPTIGAWKGGNQLAEWEGAYAEYMAWHRTGTHCRMENGWSAGAGVYGYYSDGSIRSGYHWWEKGFGPQVGVKYLAPEWQWQLKGRLLWEDVSGGSPSGYSMHQEDLKLGLYSEYLNLDDIQKGHFWGLQAEAWWMLGGASIDSTWSGDIPANRGMFSVDVFYQQKLSQDWQWRASLGLFHQEWDDLAGTRFGLELRWYKTIMFGPSIAFYPFGLNDAYTGIATASDLTTITGLIRAELRRPLLDYFCGLEKQKVKEQDAEWLRQILLNQQK